MRPDHCHGKISIANPTAKPPDGHAQEKWEVLLGIRLLGTTFRCGLSNHEAATAQVHLVELTNIVECRPLLGALILSLNAVRQADHATRGPYIYIYIYIHIYTYGPAQQGAGKPASRQAGRPAEVAQLHEFQNKYMLSRYYL